MLDRSKERTSPGDSFRTVAVK